MVAWRACTKPVLRMLELPALCEVLEMGGRFFPRAVILSAALTICSASGAAEQQEFGQKSARDLFFAAALYEAHQDNYLDAIVGLDVELAQHRRLDEPLLDPFSFHRDQAQFSVGDLELSYRMHQQAGRAVEAVLNGDVPQQVKNEAAYRLANIHYQKRQTQNALHALQMIEGGVPHRIRPAEQFLRARVYMELGRLPEAIALLRSMKGEQEFGGFVEYNLGIALLKSGEAAAGIAELAALGRRTVQDPARQALADKANLLLASRLLEAGELQLARTHFNRVNLEGPFSNRALLGAGWVEARAGNYERALVPWQLLSERKVTDASAQEALLAVPYAYGKLEVFSTAAVNYGHALEQFGREVDVLTASIRSVREGKLLQALRRKEARQIENWVVALRELPGAPETHYLLQLMASNDYQEFLRNYHDLNDLHERNAKWQESLDALQSLIASRRAYFEPILPGIDEAFRVLDARIKLRMEERDRFAARVDLMLVSRRPEYLAKAEEIQYIQRLNDLADNLFGSNDEVSNARVARLKGVIDWRLETEYDSRLTDAFQRLQELNAEIERLQEARTAFVQRRQAATQSYAGYDQSVERLRARLRQSQDRLEFLMARQGGMLEAVAISELERRRAVIESYQVKARFALADSYDRANELLEQRDGERRAEQYRKDNSGLPKNNPPELNPGDLPEGGDK